MLFTGSAFPHSVSYHEMSSVMKLVGLQYSIPYLNPLNYIFVSNL
jgi:hypothetical protein